MARVVPASEAKLHLASLLDEVARGETIIITRRGQPVARMVREPDRRKVNVDQAIEGGRRPRK